MGNFVGQKHILSTIFHKTSSNIWVRPYGISNWENLLTCMFCLTWRIPGLPVSISVLDCIFVPNYVLMFNSDFVPVLWIRLVRSLSLLLFVLVRRAWTRISKKRLYLLYHTVTRHSSRLYDQVVKPRLSVGCSLAWNQVVDRSHGKNICM